MQSSKWRAASDIMCSATRGVLCEISVDVICGTGTMDDANSISKFAEYFPCGTSFKNMLHFAQGAKHNSFRRFDYGSLKNMQVYGQRIPPNYNLSAYRVPTALFVADGDLLADPGDVEALQ